MVKHQGFSIVRTYLNYLGHTMYVRSAWTFHIPVQDERSYYFTRQSPLHACFFHLEMYLYEGLSWTSGTTLFPTLSNRLLYTTSSTPNDAREGPV